MSNSNHFILPILSKKIENFKIMIDSLTNTLQIAALYLNTNLVSSKTFDRLNQIGNLLPNLPRVSEVVFECHLGSSTPKTDFIAAFNTLNSGRKVSVDCCEPLASIPYANPAWSRIQDFCVRWADVESPLYENVDNIWLEFDVDGQPLEFPKPSFFFAPRGLKGVDAKENNSILTNNITYTKDWIINEALKLLFGNLLPDKIKENLLTCFDLLPCNGEISQIGVMLPRSSESKAVRLFLQGISSEQIPKYLKNVNWPGSVSQLSSIVAKLSGFADDIKFQFSVANITCPKIGLECYFNKQPSSSPKCQSFLAFLVDNQLCTLEKANALLEWSGYLEEKCNQELWPKSLAKASVFVYPNLRSAFVRLLNHIKIVYEPNQPLQAKAYISLTHRWLASNGCFKQ